MPGNTPQWLSFLLDIPPTLQGAIMAFVISLLRVIYDEQESKWTRKLLESLICAGLTLAAGGAVRAMGLDTAWVLFVGGLIGFMGADFVREKAKAYVNGLKCKSPK